MSNFLAAILIFLGLILVVTFSAIIAGTIIWLLWPVAIPGVFPGLVKSGMLAAEINWFSSVCFTWICFILIKSSQSNNNK